MNPTTLQKVLQELGAIEGKDILGSRVWYLRGIGFDLGEVTESPTRVTVALIIAEIEEALREEGFTQFRFEEVEPDRWLYPNQKHWEAFVGRLREGREEEFDGFGPSKLAAWCDLFLKYKGVQDGLPR